MLAAIYRVTKLRGVVKVNETYFGGKESNKHVSKKLNAGRRAVGKTAVVGIKERGGETRAAPVTDTSANTLHGQLLSKVEKGSTVYSDEHGGYQGIDVFLNHKTVKHSVAKYVKGQAHTNEIESFWSMMKRGYEGVYHKISPKHLHRYVDEFAGRHNIRKFDTLVQMVEVVRNFEGKRMTYEQLVADNQATVGVA